MSLEQDDPMGSSILVTKVECLKAHMKLEHRLTRLEAMNALTLIAAISTFLGIVVIFWRGV